MNSTILALSLIAQALGAPNPVPVQFLQGSIGENVTVSIDGHVETTFAGKLAFQDQNSRWLSVCADVRSPITDNQIFSVVPQSTARFGGNVARAGNIVAKFFRDARTPDQCAGLQLAVWKALEDAPEDASFSQGHFQVRAGLMALYFAQQYSQGADEDGNALYLQVQGGDSGGQGGGGSQGGSGGGGQSQISG